MRTRWRIALKGGQGLLTLALALALVAMAGPAEAVPISSFTGNTGILSNTAGTGIDGTVNYAVYTSENFLADTTAAFRASFVAGVGPSPALDLGAGIYVYAFQLTNSGANGSTITNFSVGRSPIADVTSWGYFNGAVFTDLGGQVSASNPLDTGTTSVGFFLDSGTNPSLLWKASTSLQASLSLAAGSSSSLMVYTSHAEPDWFSTQLNGGGVGAMGLAPGAVPEPGSLLLMTTGLAGLVQLRRRLSRKGGDR